MKGAVAGGATFNYPSFNDPGCPAPVQNFLTQRRTSGDTASACGLRRASSITASLNDVAVPGANSFDAVGLGLTGGAAGSLTTGGYSILTALILGGQTQLQRAVQLDPTFATVWIGNNDVLAGAIQSVGDSTKATSLANFQSNYRTLVNGLVAGSPNLKGGVLIGVVDPTAVPILVPLAVFNPNVPGSSAAAYQAVNFGIFGAGTRRPATFRLQFAPNCTTSGALIPFPALTALAAQIPAAAPSFTFDCSGASPLSATTTQTNVLVTDAERAFYSKRVADYNTFIKARADSLGFAYLDPNTLFAQLRAAGAIPLFPNLAVADTARPFAVNPGTAQQVRYITNDGVHPSTTAHYVLANALIALINSKYGASLGAKIRALTPADTTGL